MRRLPIREISSEDREILSLSCPKGIERIALNIRLLRSIVVERIDFTYKFALFSSSFRISADTYM